MKSLVSWAFLPAWKLVSRRRMLALPILFLLTAVAVSAAIALNAHPPNPFFDPSIGTNGQACVTCHEPQTGITITPPFIREKFEESDGTSAVRVAGQKGYNCAAASRSLSNFPSLSLNCAAPDSVRWRRSANISSPAIQRLASM